LIRCKKSKGFSLIEVLIALVILAIALLALAGLMVQSTNSNSWGSHLTEASTFAQDKLEELRMTTWANLVLEPFTDVRTGATGTNYTRTWTVTTNGTGNLRTVSINISWTDKTNHTITILSAITQ
jgi:type IV pilus assembly protein PilV